MKAGDKVLVFGKRLATVVGFSANGKRVNLTGEFTGWTHASNVKAVTT